MSSLGLGHAAAQPLPFGNSFWDVGFWNFSSSSSPITSDVPNAANSNVLTPHNSPLVVDTAEYGLRGVQVTDTGVNTTIEYFTAPAVGAALLSGLGHDLTIVQRFRQNKVAEMPLWSGHIFSNPDYIGARSVAQRMCLRKSSTVGGTVTGTGALDIQYDDHTYVWTFKLSTREWRQYVDGVLDLVTTLDAQPLTINTLAILATFSTAAFEAATGFCQIWGMSGTWIDSDQQQELYTYCRSLDYTLHPSTPGLPQIVGGGASIWNGATDEVNAAGNRATISQEIVDKRLSILNVGEFSSGVIPNRATPSISGAEALAITLQITSHLSVDTKIVFVDLGNGEINEGQTAAQVLSAMHTALTTIRTAAPDVPVVVMNLPAYFESGFNAVCATVNAGVGALWDSVDAAFPGKPTLYRIDRLTPMGGQVYDNTFYAGVGNNHPNHLGYSQIGPFLLGAQNAAGDTVAALMRRISPT